MLVTTRASTEAAGSFLRRWSNLIAHAQLLIFGGRRGLFRHLPVRNLLTITLGLLPTPLFSRLCLPIPLIRLVQRPATGCLAALRAAVTT